MQTETFIIMMIGLLAIGLIRLVIAIGGREYAADHPHVKSRGSGSSTEDGLESDGAAGATLTVPSQRPVRGTGRQSHLLYFPETPEPLTDSEPVMPTAS